MKNPINLFIISLSMLLICSCERNKENDDSKLFDFCDEILVTTSDCRLKSYAGYGDSIVIHYNQNNLIDSAAIFSSATAFFGCFF